MQASALFTLPDFPFLNTSVFDPKASAWDWIQNISKTLETFDFCKNTIPKQIPLGLIIGKRVYIHETVQLPPYGVIEGPVLYWSRYRNPARGYDRPKCNYRPKVCDWK
jgi:hypothetical protein